MSRLIKCIDCKKKYTFKDICGGKGLGTPVLIGVCSICGSIGRLTVRKLKFRKRC